MGFFDKLFGSRKETPSAPILEPVRTWQENPKPPAETKPQGELPVGDFVSEAHESPRIVVCQQYKYGKFVQLPDGPILPGVEHTYTGMSQDMPREMVMSPGIFKDDLPNSIDRYPWKGEGGEIIKILVEKNGRPYVLIARRMMRSEGGFGSNQRDYTEMHALVLPAESWSVALVPQLADALIAKGRVRSDSHLPPIEFRTDILDKPLPPDWLDDATKDLIAIVVGGKPVALQEWQTTEKDFAQRLFRCLICLPEKLARQSSFGIGLGPMKSAGETRIAHTMAAKGLRKIGGQWKDMNPEDSAFGDRYLAALIQAVHGSTTPREVIRAVASLPPELLTETEKRFRI